MHATMERSRRDPSKSKGSQPDKKRSHLHLTSKLTQLRLFFFISPASDLAASFALPRGKAFLSFAEGACDTDLDRDSSMRASQSVNSSSPGAEAVDETETSRLNDGRAMVSGLLKRGEELRAGSLPAAMEEEEDEDECEKRGRRRLLYGASSEEESRDESERFGPEWKEIASAGAGTGSWKRTVRLGLGVEEDVMEERPPVEWMEDWSALV
jgi:hypothetical protein